MLCAHRIVLFGLVDGAGATEEAGIEDKVINNKGLTAEQAVILEVLAHLGDWGLLEAGQGDVRAELAGVRFQAEVKEAGGDLALQQMQRITLFDAGPDDAWLAAWGEEADPLQLQGKFWHRNLGQSLADIEESGAVDLADETESEVELLGWSPAGVG